jgi:hypothetical protein
MSLKLKKVDTFSTRVNVQLATEDPDRTQDVSFVAKFKHLDRKAFDALMESEPSDTEFLDQVLVGAAEISDESGAPVAFETAREAIASDLALAGATVRAFVEALGGAREKNSSRSRAR